VPAPVAGSVPLGGVVVGVVGGGDVVVVVGGTVVTGGVVVTGGLSVVGGAVVTGTVVDGTVVVGGLTVVGGTVVAGGVVVGGVVVVGTVVAGGVVVGGVVVVVVGQSVTSELTTTGSKSVMNSDAKSAVAVTVSSGLTPSAVKAWLAGRLNRLSTSLVPSLRTTRIITFRKNVLTSDEGPALAVTEPVSLPLQSTEACTVTDGSKIGMHPTSLLSVPSGHDVAADGSTVAELLGAKAKKPPTTMSAVASTRISATPRGRLVDCLMRYPFEGLWFACLRQTVGVLC